MSFIDSYKRLEKLCSEIYSDNHGVSTYIDEMLGKPSGSRYVSGWDEDLKQLKHYRWVRNQIVHEPGCTEENMCEPGDAKWIDVFYYRIMNQTDPLALYAKAEKPRPAQKPMSTRATQSTNYTPSQYKKTSAKYTGCLTYLIGIMLVILAVVWISNII
ncbi:MAG: hypothetical protein NC247_06630 [Ruminococcus flavefaciens]|nr:hypothetical protein [Ruminococcus flavefaciens]